MLLDIPQGSLVGQETAVVVVYRTSNFSTNVNEVGHRLPHFTQTRRESVYVCA
jgi:hypothetical protein